LRPKFSPKERKQLNLSRFYAIAQIEYCRNFIFKRNFPIHKLFERSCELRLWRLTADKIAEIFGTRLNRKMRGKLATGIDRIEHGHTLVQILNGEKPANTDPVRLEAPRARRHDRGGGARLPLPRKPERATLASTHPNPGNVNEEQPGSGYEGCRVGAPVENQRFAAK